MERRKPAVAGIFYDGNRASLERTLSALFHGKKEGSCRIVVSPHAGYVYSGNTAAHSISSLKPGKRFIILGPNHHLAGPDFSVMASGEWETPLGSVPVDSGLAKKLLGSGILEADVHAHSHEHSIEVQLPFLQHRFTDFSFVPVSIKNMGYSESFMKDCIRLGESIAKSMGDDVRLIASSDFSHYLPLKEADRKDSRAFSMIRNLDVSGFFRVLDEEDASICGFGPIAVAMSAAKALDMKKGELIHKSSSGDVTGDYTSVVAYYAIGFS